jgi:hypothetical protein
MQARRTPRRAISGPLTPVNSGQPRSPGTNELPSSAALTTRRHTPSKLVMRVRFPSPALFIYSLVRHIIRWHSPTVRSRDSLGVPEAPMSQARVRAVPRPRRP